MEFLVSLGVQNLIVVVQYLMENDNFLVIEILDTPGEIYYFVKKDLHP